MLNTVKISSCELINADCLEFIQTLPENSVDLIVTDPPYFKVKPEGWDNQWKGDDDYLKWLDQCLAQFWRVLKPAGSLYLFCGHRLASDIEIMMRERFSVLNHIIWAKPSGRWNGCNKESLRAYFPATERILFAEHYQGPYRPKDAGYEAKGRALKQHVMAPLIAYFRDARAALGITAKQIVDATGKKNMVSHWFSASQWQLPDESDYLKLQALFARVAEEKHQR
ncbi:site-specific DNA-methyltransferase, partial [Escherichia coli]|nr:site-specific DNA-methyltransferase [Escherichia coli]EKE9925158.1 site-specific DNA-methyltransferase [Escherichia coli]EKF0082178.1 site-specific DNA-methyltransferase [Escherichia coli]EKF0481217.1 site-specific DNA-methyltransferase [Escherichia coli]EKF0888348.1 site-specific DNA-methyltransferase [Escherichia coli]